MKLTTTLARIKANDPYKDELGKLLKHLWQDYPDDKEINLLTILENDGLPHFFGALKTVEDQELAKCISVELAIKFAERALPIFEKEYPKNNKPRKAIEVAKTWLKRNKKIYGSTAYLVADLATAWEVSRAAKSEAFEKSLFVASWAASAAAWAANAPVCIEKLGSAWALWYAAEAAYWAANDANWAVGGTIESEAFKAERQAQIDIIKELLA